MSMWSTYVGGRAHLFLGDHCQMNNQGWVFPEGATYQCFPDKPGKVRKADVSFILRDRLSLAEATQEGHCPIAPDLVVDVVSATDLTYEVDRQAHDFLAAGTRLVWIITPVVNIVRVLRAVAPGTILTEKDTLTGESVIPGFACHVRELFIPPQA